MEKSGKELRKITKPTFLDVGGKQVISTGKWNNDLMGDYVLEHGRAKWVSVAELAKTSYLQSMPRTKARVRQCLHQLVNNLLARGFLLVIEYSGPHGRAQAVKIADPTSELDRQAADAQIERRRRRKEWSTAQYERALSILRMTMEHGPDARTTDVHHDAPPAST